MRIDTARRSVSLDPVDPDFFNNPYPAYHAIRAEVPVFKWEQYGYWCFARHEDVNALLRDRRFGRQILHVASREELGWLETPPHLKPFYDFESRSLLELEPPVHTRLRSLVNRSFLSRQVERLRPMITNLSNRLIDRFETAHEVDLLPAFATPIPVIVICELLGVPPDMSQQLLAWSHDMVAMYQARRDAAIEEAAVKATIAFSDFMRGYIAQRRKQPRDDLLSELIRAEEQGAKLTEDELVTTAVLLLNAGHEATVHAIGNGIKCLLEHNVRDGIGEGHIEETLRYDAPLHLFTRYALEDLDYAGIKFRKGETVGLMLGAANRDPGRFPAPDRFIPEREPNPQVSFGAGIHFCIGAPLARLEMQIAMPLLFQRLPKLRLAEQPHYRNAYHFHGLESLKVAF
ncbi:cytochrome P450 [Aestuariivirga sp.]|uniref:cytochrome P450 n=1 Tax=Aestuariivirga sp. TaxID=2650926 RepID=UPI00359385D3